MTQALSRRALLLGGAAAILTALTTFLLWYLPRVYDVEPGFAGSVALHAEPAYMARLWVNYVHVFVALFAYGVVGAVVFRRAPVAASVGFVAFLVWCMTEAIGISVNIWAVNATWRAGFEAADASTQAVLRASLNTFAGVWDGLFFVLLTAFLIGTLAYGLALWDGDLLQRTVAILMLLAVPLTIVIMLDGYFGQSLSQWISWSYPLLQPLSRALMGVWLLQLALRSPASRS